MAQVPHLRAPFTPALLLAAGMTLAAGMPGPAARAQEAEPAPAGSATTPTQADGKSTEATGRPATAGGEVFVPTEEISEDYAVSFPVDI